MAWRLRLRLGWYWTRLFRLRRRLGRRFLRLPVRRHNSRTQWRKRRPALSKLRGSVRSQKLEQRKLRVLATGCGNWQSDYSPLYLISLAEMLNTASLFMPKRIRWPLIPNFNIQKAISLFLRQRGGGFLSAAIYLRLW